MLSATGAAAQSAHLDVTSTQHCACQVSEGLDVVAAIDEAFVDDSGRPLQVPDAPRIIISFVIIIGIISSIIRIRIIMHQHQHTKYT